MRRQPTAGGADGVVRPAHHDFAELTTPALRATPPLRGGEWSSPKRLPIDFHNNCFAFADSATQCCQAVIWTITASRFPQPSQFVN